jgi:acyl carrier protein phosphodiesterase
LNYLVHLFLAGTDPGLQLGALMGDFVKGPVPAGFPDKIAVGLHLHRRIDTLAQNSAHIRQSRQKLQMKFGHGRGIIIDIFYDHFLASSWGAYSPQPLPEFAEQVYQLLQENHDLLPAGLQRILPFMVEHNWLVSYQHRDVVAKALQRLAQRLSRPLPLAEGIDDLIMHEASLRQDFKHFMTEAADFVKREFSISIRHAT